VPALYALVQTRIRVCCHGFYAVARSVKLWCLLPLRTRLNVFGLNITPFCCGHALVCDPRLLRLFLGSVVPSFYRFLPEHRQRLPARVCPAALHQRFAQFAATRRSYVSFCGLFLPSAALPLVATFVPFALPFVLHRFHRPSSAAARTFFAFIHRAVHAHAATPPLNIYYCYVFVCRSFGLWWTFAAKHLLLPFQPAPFLEQRTRTQHNCIFRHSRVLCHILPLRVYLLFRRRATFRVWLLSPIPPCRSGHATDVRHTLLLFSTFCLYPTPIYGFSTPALHYVIHLWLCRTVYACRITFLYVCLRFPCPSRRLRLPLVTCLLRLPFFILVHTRVGYSGWFTFVGPCCSLRLYIFAGWFVTHADVCSPSFCYGASVLPPMVATGPFRCMVRFTTPFGLYHCYLQIGYGTRTVLRSAAAHAFLLPVCCTVTFAVTYHVPLPLCLRQLLGLCRSPVCRRGHILHFPVAPDALPHAPHAFHRGAVTRLTPVAQPDAALTHAPHHTLHRLPLPPYVPSSAWTDTAPRFTAMPFATRLPCHRFWLVCTRDIACCVLVRWTFAAVCVLTLLPDVERFSNFAVLRLNAHAVPPCGVSPPYQFRTPDGTDAALPPTRFRGACCLYVSMTPRRPFFVGFTPLRRTTKRHGVPAGLARLWLPFTLLPSFVPGRGRYEPTFYAYTLPFSRTRTHAFCQTRGAFLYPVVSCNPTPVNACCCTVLAFYTVVISHAPATFAITVLLVYRRWDGFLRAAGYSARCLRPGLYFCVPCVCRTFSLYAARFFLDTAVCRARGTTFATAPRRFRFFTQLPGLTVTLSAYGTFWFLTLSFSAAFTLFCLPLDLLPSSPFNARTRCIPCLRPFLDTSTVCLHARVTRLPAFATAHTAFATPFYERSNRVHTLFMNIRSV